MRKILGLGLSLVVGLTVATSTPSAEATHVSTHQAAANKTVAKKYLLALGDSYSVGVQDEDKPTLHGPNNQLVKLAKKRGYAFKLVNLGCAGATTSSMLEQVGCPDGAQAVGGTGYPDQTQVQAAVAFLQEHKGDVGLITLSIGGNDVNACVGGDDVVGCVTDATAGVSTNLDSILEQLRAAGGKRVRIVGTSYPDVLLGAWVHPEFFTGAKALAKLSVTAFKTIINPALKKTYAAHDGQLVDVTRATGAYVSLTKKVNDPVYGKIPVAVKRVCTLTYFCSSLNIHMTTAGYAIIAGLEAATLPKRHA